mmetsp:Transcript_1030/g.2868  ORF Transcript_1030/g.2868 Transcript_1030/m.2868 type:complete len:621 (+) Transcript_1030:41-1903(+)
MACKPMPCFSSDEVDEVAKEAFPAYSSDVAPNPFGQLRSRKGFEEVVVTQLQALERKIEQLHDCCSTLANSDKVVLEFKQLLSATESRLREEVTTSSARLEMKCKLIGPQGQSSDNLTLEAQRAAERPRRHLRTPPAARQNTAQLADPRSMSHLSLESVEHVQVNTHSHGHRASRGRSKAQSSGLNAHRRAHLEHQQSFADLLTSLATASYSGKPIPKRLSTANFSAASAAPVASTTRPSAQTQASGGTTPPQASTPQNALMRSHEPAEGERSKRSSKRSSLMHHHPDMGRMMMRLQNTRATVQIWNFLETPESSSWALWYVRLMICVIFSSVLVTFLQLLSPPALDESHAGVAEIAFDVIFVTDEGSTEFAVLVGAVPVCRLLKILRHFEKFQLLLSAFAMAFEALPILLFTLLLIVMICSFMIYLAEPRSTIESLPFSMWFTIVTMTTVGYGDIVPETPVGYGVTVGLIIGSVLYMSIPIGIVGNAFSRVWEDRDRLLLVQRTRDCLLKGGYKPQDIPGLFAIFDKHHSGELTFPAFRRMLAEMKIGLSQERIVGLFNSFDVDSSGTISAEEFIKVLFPEAHAVMFGTDPDMSESVLDEEDNMDICVPPSPVGSDVGI